VRWYRTTFDLNLPAGVDAPLGLYIPHAQDKVVIWLNGLLIGRYLGRRGTTARLLFACRLAP